MRGRDPLEDRLGLVELVTRNVTTQPLGVKNETPASTEVEAGGNVPDWARRDSNGQSWERDFSCSERSGSYLWSIQFHTE
jgi:hypothetical protein